MYIAKNLQYLRKREKITQEDLAEKLNVSRQSVSKWETGEAYPETEKLLALCDMFNVSLDGLMRSDLANAINADGNNNDNSNTDSISQGEPEAIASGATGATDYAVYENHINKFSSGIAIGVLLIILGVAICVALSGYSFLIRGVFAKYANASMIPNAAADIISAMSGVAVIAFTAAAIFIFVLFGHRHENFKKAHPIIAEPSVPTDIRGFAVKMAALVSGILIDVVYLVVMASLVGTGIIETLNEDMAICLVTATFLTVLAFLVGGLVQFGIRRSKLAVGEYNKQTASEQHPTQSDKIIGAACGAVMLTATAVFLLIGFIGGYWHPAWVAFPTGGIICAIINVIYNAKNK